MSSWMLQPEWFSAIVEMRGCLELRGRHRVPRFWFLGVLLPVGPEELHSGGYLGGALLFSVGGNGWEIFGHLFQDALVCCSCGVMKYCRNADKLMTWKTSFHNENVRVWRPAWWLGRVLWFFSIDYEGAGIWSFPLQYFMALYILGKTNQVSAFAICLCNM